MTEANASKIILSNTGTSLERYGLNAFPLALTLAVLLKREQLERVVLMGLAGGMVALSALAWTGAYVP